MFVGHPLGQHHHGALGGVHGGRHGAVGDKIAARACRSCRAEMPDTVTLVRDGIEAVREPLRDFLKANASESERERFFDVAQPPAARGAGSGEVGPDDLTWCSRRSW